MGMAHLKYLVVFDLGRWKINHDGRLFGAYDTEQEAVSSAMELAFSHSMKGHKVEVLTRDRLGGLRAICTYGRDGPPARR